MIPYILHVSILISLFILFYKLILEKETHYQFNRAILLGGIILALILPTVTIPAAWSLIPPEASQLAPPAISENIPAHSHEFFPGEMPEVLPVPEIAETKTLTAPVTPSVHPVILFLRELSPLQWGLIIYFLGVIFFAVRLWLQITRLIRLIRTLPRKQDGKYTLLRKIDEEASYSFFNYIFINPFPYDISTYRQILKHEKIHADQIHSLDILLGEILLVIQWFNPLVWMYRKAIRQNLEYITDHIMVRNGADQTEYQFSLVKVSAPIHTHALVANYNHSLLKKRILMMNAEKSHPATGWKYFLLVPVLALSVSLFNATSSENPVIGPDTPELQLAQAPVNSFVTRTLQQGEEFADFPSPATGSSTAKVSLTSFPDETQEISGTWEAKVEGEKVCMRIIRKVSDEDWNWIQNDCYERSDFSLSNITEVPTFFLKRKAGIITFDGSFSGIKGEGTFTFKENASYRQELSSKGVKEISEELMFRLFFAHNHESFVANLVDLSSLGLPANILRKIQPEGIDADIVKEYQAEGLDIEKNLNFIRSHASPSLIREYQKAGLDPEKNKNFVYSHVSPDLLKEYKAAGFDPEENKNFVYSHVSPDLLKEYKDAGIDPEENKTFVYSHVSPELLKEYKAAGFDPVKYKNFVHSHVSPETLREYQDAGIDPEENKNLVYSHVSPELLKQYKAAGFDPEEYKNFLYSHVSPDLIRQYRDAGFDPQENKNFVFSHVGPELLKEYKEAGFDPEKHKDFVYSHVSPDLLKQYKAAGIDLEKNKNFLYSHVSPDLLKKYTEAGFDPVKYKNFVHSHVSPEMLKQYKEAGFDPDENKNFVVSHVSPSLLKEYRDAGIDPQENKSFLYSHVSPDLLKEYKDAGFNPEDYKKYIFSHISADFLKSYRDAGLDIDEHEEFIFRRMSPEKVKDYRDKVKNK